MKSSYIINNDSIINNAYAAVPCTESVVLGACSQNPLGVYLAEKSILVLEDRIRCTCRFIFAEIIDGI